MQQLLHALWQQYKQRPGQGLVKSEVLTMISDLAGVEVKEQFQMMLETTEEIDFEEIYKDAGVEFVWQQTSPVDIGAKLESRSDRVFVVSVNQDGAAYKSGLNAGDELLFLNGQRFLGSDLGSLEKLFVANQRVECTISRMEQMSTVSLLPEKGKRQLAELKVVDESKAKKVFDLT